MTNWIGTLFDRIISLHADTLIRQIIDLHGHSDYDDRMFQKLIENSKTAACGELIIMLLASTEEKKQIVWKNLHLIPDSAFPDKVMLLEFRDLLIQCGKNGDGRCRRRGRRGRRRRLSQSDMPTQNNDDYNLQTCGINDQSICSTLKSSTPGSDRGTNNADDKEAMSSQTHEITPSRTYYGVEEPTITVEQTDRYRLHVNCAFLVKDYPIKIKELGLPLYSGLEAIAHLVSKRNLTDKNLLLLLLPYFKDLAVSVSILEDVRCIALKKCSSQKDSVQDNLRKLFDINKDGRVDTFSVAKYYDDTSEFLVKLASKKQISLNLDYGKLCPICHNRSTTVSSSKSKKSNKKVKSHFLKNIEIDLSSESKIDFIGDEEFHKDHLIHCYIIGLCADKTPISYVSILQLKVPEIIDNITKGKFSGLRIVAVFSRSFCSKI